MGKDLKGKDLGRGYSQRKDKRFEARAMINGTKICLYDMHLPTLKKRFEEEKIKILRDEKNIRPNLTLSEWFEEWFEKYKKPALKSEVSKKAYHRKVSNTYIAAIGDKKIENISHMNMQDTTNELLSKFKARTLREALGVLRECLDIAVMNQIIKSNPCINIAIKDLLIDLLKHYRPFPSAKSTQLDSNIQYLTLTEVLNGTSFLYTIINT